jgi:outer membrane protein assembly factor BamB
VRAQSKLLITLLCLSFISSCSPQPGFPENSHELTIQNEKIKLIWSKSDVYTVWTTFDITIDARNNRVCFLGGLDTSTDSDVVCLNGTNGGELWQADSGTHRSLAMTTDAIYVIYSNSTGIRKYDTGKVIWSKRLIGTGSNYLNVSDEQLQVLTIPERFWILDLEGNELKSISGEKIFTSTNQGEFVESGGIQLVKTESDDVIWQFHDFDDVVEMAPLFTSTNVFVRTGQESGSIFAINRENGSFLWQTDNNIVSNVVYSPSKQAIYALTNDGNLLAIDENSGSTNIIAEFSSVPFVHNGEANVASYQLAYDINEGILFVSLGDSRQLFALKEE